MKNLEVGKNYGDIFGLSTDKKQQLIYRGDDNWEAIEGDRRKVIKSANTSKSALDYINRPAIHMGRI